MLKHIGFIVSSLWTIAWQSIIYHMTGDQYRFVKNLADTLIERNVFYVKAFQALSANTHALEASSSQYLSSFADNVDYRESEVDADAIALLKSRGIVFDKDVPCNAGMVSLVYAAKLPTGESVAIKIRRKGIEEELRLCLDQIGELVYVLCLLPHFKRLNLQDMFEENRDLMLEQINYVNETKNMQKLTALNKRIDYIRIPRLYMDYTDGLDDHVIVMEYLEGRKMEALDETERDKYSYTMAKMGIKSLLFDGVYHGDLHQGNILFMGTSETPVLGILDLGIVGTLTREEQNNFFQFFNALVQHDYSTAADAIVSALAEPLDRVHELTDGQREQLLKTIEQEAKQMIEVTKECGMKEVNNLNRELGHHGLRLSRSFCKVQLSLAMAEGVNKGLTVDKTYIQQIEAACKAIFPQDLSQFSI